MPVRPFGSVRKLPSGRYQARWQAPDGKERHAETTFATKTAARAWLAAQETDRGRGGWVDPDKGKRTFGVYAKEWVAGRPDLRPRTAELYEGLLRLHVLPRLGPVELGRLDTAAIRAWRAHLLRTGIGPVTVAKCYRLVRTILNTAVADKLIVANPCAIKGAGAETSPERPTATVGEVYAIAGAIDPRFRALVVLAAFSGCRWGELTALRWEDVDLEDGAVTVSKAAVEMRDGSRLIGPPKTEQSRRTVAIPAPVVAELRAHQAAYGDSDLVFTGAKGAPLRRGNFHKAWSKALEVAGLPAALHFHDLRHTGNTLAAATGASTKELMARMGHASQRAALIYQHASPERDRAIADALGDMIGASRHAAGTTSAATA